MKPITREQIANNPALFPILQMRVRNGVACEEDIELLRHLEDEAKERTKDIDPFERFRS